MGELFGCDIKITASAPPYLVYFSGESRPVYQVGPKNLRPLNGNGLATFCTGVPIRVCATQRGHDFGTPDLERGIHIQDF